MYLQSRSKAMARRVAQGSAGAAASEEECGYVRRGGEAHAGSRSASNKRARPASDDCIGPKYLIALTFESQRLGSSPWLADTLKNVSQGLDEFLFGERFTNSLDVLDSAAESAIPLLQERITVPDPSIDEVVEEMERALLISLVVTLTSHNVLVQKVAAWEQPHQRFLQGNLPADVGHYFDVKTLSYVGTGGPGRIHMQDLGVCNLCPEPP